MLAKSLTEEQGPLWVALLTASVFALSSIAGFVYDDIILIANNAYAQSFEHLGRAFRTHFWDTAGAPRLATLSYYRPLVTASYILDWELGGGAPWLFHVTNTCLHAVTVWLAGRFSRRVLGGSPLWLVPTLLFAFHPTRLESVLWIAGRSDVLLTLWLLLSVEAAAVWRRSKRYWAAVGLGLFSIAALLSKELALLLPLFIIADRQQEGARHRSSELLSRSADVLLATLVGFAYVALRSVHLPLGAAERTLTPSAFLAAVEGYAERLLLPWPTGFFFRPLVVGEDGFVHSSWQLLLGAAIVVTGCGLLVHSWKNNRAAFWFLLTAAVALAPFLHLIPTGLAVLVADRFWYLPMLPLGIGLTLLLQAPLERFWHRQTLVAPALLSALPLAALGALLLSLPDYQSDEALWRNELARDACNPSAHEHLAKQLAAQGRLEAAQAHLGRTLSADCIGQTLAHRQLPLNAYARSLELEAAQTADGDHDKLRALFVRLAQLYQGRGQAKPEVIGLPAPAPPFFQHLTQKPRPVPQPGNIAAELAALAARMGDDSAALRWSHAALQQPLSQLAGPANLVLALARIGQLERARSLLTRLKAAKPKPLLAPDQAHDLSQRLDEASGLLQAAQSQTPLQASMLKAQAQASLGAYGRAIEALRPAYREHPRPPVAVLWVQLLVAARLEAEARQVLMKLAPLAGADRIITQIRSSLSPELQSIPALGPGSTHYRAPGQ